MPNQSRYTEHDAAIRELSAEGKTSGQIVSALGLAGTDRGLRKYMDRVGIPTQPKGGRPGSEHYKWRGGRHTDHDGRGRR